MFELSVKGSKKIVKEFCKNFGKACKEDDYVPGDQIFEEKVQFDPLELSCIEARSSEEVVPSEWKNLDYCMPSLDDNE